MDISNIILSVLGLLVAGSGVWIFTLKSTKRKAESEANSLEQDVYQELIKDLREDKDFLKKDKVDLKVELDEQKVKYTQLEKIVSQNTLDIEKLKITHLQEKCLNFKCKERIIG